ncbi:helix-turn-helix domain-containing protein [Dysgonomonas reticulitermitis]
MSKIDLQETDYNPFKDIIRRFDDLERKISEIHASLQKLSGAVMEKPEVNRQSFPGQEIDMDRLDKRQAAKLLKVSVRTIDRYVKNGNIPYIQHGGKVTFSFMELTDSKFNRRHRNTHKDHLSILVTNPTSAKNRE